MTYSASDKKPSNTDLIKFVYNELSKESKALIESVINSDEDLQNATHDIERIKQDFGFESSATHLNWLKAKRERVMKRSQGRVAEIVEREQRVSDLLSYAESLVQQEQIDSDVEEMEPVAFSGEGKNESLEVLEERMKSFSIDEIIALIPKANNDLIVQLIEAHIAEYLKTRFKSLLDRLDEKESENIISKVLDQVMLNAVDFIASADLDKKLESLIADTE